MKFKTKQKPFLDEQMLIMTTGWGNQDLKFKHKNNNEACSVCDCRASDRMEHLKVHTLRVRERVEDLPLLLNELISRLENEKRGSIRFNSAAIMSLCRHEWHGNVRELANLVERLAILHPYGVIGVNELPKKFRHVDEGDEQYTPPVVADVTQSDGLAGVDSPALLPVNGLDLREYLQDLECSLIQQALDDANGVVARAAEKPNIRRTTLVEKMRKYNLARKEKDMA